MWAPPILQFFEWLSRARCKRASTEPVYLLRLPRARPQLLLPPSSEEKSQEIMYSLYNLAHRSSHGSAFLVDAHRFRRNLLPSGWMILDESLMQREPNAQAKHKPRPESGLLQQPAPWMAQGKRFESERPFCPVRFQPHWLKPLMDPSLFRLLPHSYGMKSKGSDPWTLAPLHPWPAGSLECSPTPSGGLQVPES